MDALEKYVHDFSEPEEKLLHELDRETNLRACLLYTSPSPRD